ncbi:MAG: pyrroline-5-carboxylate reductase, partial [Armatimonadetes bacterium]|nr:pyrroline-5-carboxylate reductase [Armatimonadota bacterium]
MSNLPSLAFVGGGVMATAILRSVLNRELLPPSAVAVSELLPERREALRQF